LLTPNSAVMNSGVHPQGPEQVR